jgi:hypothetical protein
MNRYFLLLPLLAACQGLYAQYAIQIIQPQELTLASRSFWNCIVTNAGNETVKAYLHGTITEARDGKIYDINSADFGLKPGVTAFNTQNYTALAPEKVLFKANLYEDYVLRTNGLPRGEYRFCIELVAVGQLNVLAVSCIDISVQASTPPAIILPAFGDSICEPNPFFIWTPPQPPLSGPDVSYSLFVFEMQGQQTPVSATKTNPLWYAADNIGTPVFQYGLEGRPFVAGRGYAWYVAALEGKKEISRSDIGYFLWRNCANETPEDNPQNSAVTPNNKRKKGLQYFQIPAFDDPTAVTVTDKSLHIMYIASSLYKTVFVRLENDAGAVVTARDVPVTPGYNFISLDQASWKMEAQKQHCLILMNEQGEIQRLKFWYKPKS